MRRGIFRLDHRHEEGEEAGHRIDHHGEEVARDRGSHEEEGSHLEGREEGSREEDSPCLDRHGEVEGDSRGHREEGSLHALGVGRDRSGRKGHHAWEAEKRDDRQEGVRIGHMGREGGMREGNRLHEGACHRIGHRRIHREEGHARIHLHRSGREVHLHDPSWEDQSSDREWECEHVHVEPCRR